MSDRPIFGLTRDELLSALKEARREKRELNAHLLGVLLALQRAGCVDTGTSFCAAIDKITLERATSRAERDRYRLALDAIRRAFSFSGCCSPECACVNHEDEDCDCGYCEASDDVGAYAAEVLAGESIPYASGGGPPPIEVQLRDLRARLEEAVETRDLRDRVLAMMAVRGWSTHWIHRSAYLHLEAAELAEAVRGKHGDPADEAGDVLITLLALSPVGLDEIVKRATKKLSSLETRPPYAGEQRANETEGGG